MFQVGRNNLKMKVQQAIEATRKTANMVNRTVNRCANNEGKMFLHFFSFVHFGNSSQVQAGT